MAHILSAGIIPIFRKVGDAQLLLLRAFNYWDFPKGVVEKNEEPLKSAIRELEEETTISKVKFTWGEDFRETVPYNKGKVARYYLAECTDQNVSLPISPELGFPEHHEFRWVGFSEAKRLVSPRLLPILEWAEENLAIK